MVDLPSIPRRLSVIQTPQGRVQMISESAAAAPFRQLADSLTKLGETAEDIAKPFAERAGYEAVTRDDNGDLQVQQLPIMGPAGAVYARAARFAFLAKAQPEIEDGLTKLRLQFANDPDGFQQAAKEFADQYTGKIADPALKAPVEKTAAEAASQNYRGLLVSNERTNLQNAEAALKARLSSLNERGASLARQGGVDTPEYIQLSSDRDAIYGELIKDKRYGYPKERADAEQKENRDTDVAQSIIGNAVRTFQTKKNAVEAKKYLQDAFWGPGSEKLNLSAAKRDAAIVAGVKTLDAITSEDRAEVTAFRQTLTAYQKGIQDAPANFDPIAHNSMVAKARAIGDWKSLAELDAISTMAPLWLSLNGLPNAERGAAVSQLTRGVVPAVSPALTDQQRATAVKIEEEAKRQGVDPSVAKMTAWMESKFNSAARPVDANGKPTSSAQGPFQQIKSVRDKYGVADNAPEDDQIRGGITGIKENIDTLRRSLGRNPTPSEIYLAHMQGIGGARVLLSASPNASLKTTLDSVRPGWADSAGRTYGQVVIESNNMQRFETVGDYLGFIDRRARESVAANKGSAGYPAFAGVPLAGLVPGETISGQSRNPYVESLFWHTVNIQREKYAKDVDGMAANIEDALIKRRQELAPDELNTFVKAVLATGRADLVPKVERALATYDKYQTATAPGTAPGVAALRAQLSAVAASGINPIIRDQLNTLDTMIQNGEDAMDKAPLSEGARRGWVAPINSLNVNDSGAALGELRDREKKISVMRQHDTSLGPLKAIGNEEAQVVKTALTTGPSDQAAGLLGALAQGLSPQNYHATMTSDTMREALDGMVRSYDPVKLSAAMSTLDRLWQQDPQGFARSFGGEAVKRLQLWQSWKDSHSPGEIAERFKRADDPSFADARKRLGETADEELKKIKAPDVVSNVYAAEHPVLSWVPFVGPNAPGDELQNARLVEDFSSVYKDLRTNGMDADQAKRQAVARLSLTWGRSDAANGDKLMRFPPERYYERVGGSHSWMTDQLEADLTKQLGQPRTTRVRTDLGPVYTENWRYELIADATTESEIAGKRPPGYVVIVTDMASGRKNVVSDGEGRPLRYKWDATAPRTAAEDAFNKRRDAKRRDAPIDGMEPGLSDAL